MRYSPKQGDLFQYFNQSPSRVVRPISAEEMKKYGLPSRPDGTLWWVSPEKDGKRGPAKAQFFGVIKLEKEVIDLTKDFVLLERDGKPALS